MKIAFLNPWSNAAENQCYMSQAIAARRVGLELVNCRDEEELEASHVEFVISTASSVPKVCDYPTYLNVHEPTSRFLGNEFYLRNMLTYDGYLTISDSLRRFIHDLSFGVGRSDEPGFYFETAQKAETVARIPDVIKQGNLQVVYCGTNWDRRSPELFDLLDARGIIRIHGPLHSWPIGLKSYAGPLPFDGISPQVTYASFGIGLALLSANHLREDVVSNRIFEICSVGGVAICPDTPWIRKWFGDSVFYFDSWQLVEDIAARIVQIHEYCKTHAEEAARMGRDARAIFERNFSAEVMLSNAVDYHNRTQKARSIKRRALGPAPLIAVIMRCGGRDVEYVKRAMDSVSRQSFGRFVLIMVKYRAVDLSQIIAGVSSSIESVVELDVPNGNRGATLFAGLAKLRDLDAEYFAVLDDDDFWLSNHIESLFSIVRKAGREFDVAFSGTIAMTREGREIERNLLWKRNVFTFGFREKILSIRDVTREFSSNCFVARADLIPEDVCDPDMETAEDSWLISLVARYRRPIFSYQATAFFTKDAPDGASFESHPQRYRDEVSFFLRSSLLYGPDWFDQGSIGTMLEHWKRIEIARRKAQVDRITTAAKVIAEVDLGDLYSEPHWIGASVRLDEPTIVETVNTAWGYSAILPLARLRQQYHRMGNALFWQIEAEVCSGEVGVGLIESDELVFERLLNTGDGRMTIYLPAAGTAADLIVRNGAQGGISRVAIYGIRLVQIGRGSFSDDLLG
jgi:hypothetical protein